MASQNDTTCSMAIIPTTKISATNRMLQNKSMAMLPRDSQIKPLKFEYNESEKSVHETRLVKNPRRLIGWMNIVRYLLFSRATLNQIQIFVLPN